MTKKSDIYVEWTDDCSGKKDYDADIVRLSSRYWPRGGGFMLLNNGRIEENDTRPEIKPSAISHILLGDEDLARCEFEGETETEVKAQVEAWATEQIARVTRAVRAEFSGG